MSRRRASLKGKDYNLVATSIVIVGIIGIVVFSYLASTGQFAGIGIAGPVPVSLPSVSDSLVEPIYYEAGSVSVDHNWKQVFYTEDLENPVVIVNPISYNGVHPAHARIRNVNSATKSFEIKVEEWDYLDGIHAPEYVSYAVFESGKHIIDGKVIEVGLVSASNSFIPVKFSNTFPTTPVVLTQSQTINDPSSIVTREDKVTALGFNVKVQEEDYLQSTKHKTETIGYVAAEQGAYYPDGSDNLEVGVMNKNVGSEWYTQLFDLEYTIKPVFIASMQTYIGGDTSGLRYKGLGSNSVQVKVEEESSLDAETTHVPESVGYFAFSPPSLNLASMIKNINIGKSISSQFGTRLTSKIFKALHNSVATHLGNEYDAHDEILLDSSSPILHSSLSSLDDNYQQNVAIEVTKRGISYYYLLDDAFDLTTASNTHPITIEFLGKPLEISSIVDSNTITINDLKEEHNLKAGEYFFVNNKKIILNDISKATTCTVNVNVDGQDEVISTATETVNGFILSAKDCNYNSDKSKRSATIIVTIFEGGTYSNSDAFRSSNADDPIWVWDLGNLKTLKTGSTNCGSQSEGPCIGLVNDFVRDDWSDNPVQVGESYDLPLGFADINFDSLTVPASDYMNLKYNINSADLSGASADGKTWGTNEKALIFAADTLDTIVLSKSLIESSGQTASSFKSDVSTDKIWMVYNQNSGSADKIDLFYADKSNNPKYAGEVDATASYSDFGTLNFMQTSGKHDIILGIGNYSIGAKSYIKVTHPDTEETISSMWLVTNGDFSHLGTQPNTAESHELAYDSNNIGAKSGYYKSKYGIMILDPVAGGQSDIVNLKVPGDVVKAKVSISGVNRN